MTYNKTDNVLLQDNVPVKNKVEDKMDNIKKDVDILKKNISGFAHKAIESSSETVADAKKMAEDELEKIRTFGSEGLKKAQEQVRNKPATSVAVAFVAGMLLNSIFNRK